MRSRLISDLDLEKYRSGSGPEYHMSRADLAQKIVSDKFASSKRKVKKIAKRAEEIESFKKELNIDDHLIDIEELKNRYGINLDYGLSDTKAKELLKVNGRNALIPPKTKSMFAIFCGYLFGGFAIVLWIGASLCFASYTINRVVFNESSENELYLAMSIVIIVICTGVFGFYQEWANRSIMASFKNLLPKMADVVRNGKKVNINSEELVLGDVVILRGGDCVPADVRVIEANTLKVDNSSITGESDPQHRFVDCTDVNPLETANLAFFGTHIVEGEGKGVVIACGNNTLMGHIAALTAGLHTDTTPIKREIEMFTRYLIIIASLLGVAFFIVALAYGIGLINSFIFMIAIIVANVPEGLPVTMTAALTLTAKKMAGKNCLCKNLHAVETLGSTSVICSDKTGTLTQNKMTVAHIYYDNSTYDVLTQKHAGTSDTFSYLVRVGMLCSRASFSEGQVGVDLLNKIIVGDASECAVMKCMELLAGGTIKFRESNPKIVEIPFNSVNKYQVSIHRVEDSTDYILVIKGAPERILERSSTVMLDAKVEELTPELRRKIEMAILDLGFRGERVLGFADFVLPPAEFPPDFAFETSPPNFPLTGLRLLGFMSMIDPPRPGVYDSVEKCKSAGIRVCMVTGDHPVTAVAIAKMVNIISPDSETAFDLAMRKNISVENLTMDEKHMCKAMVVTGSDLRQMSAQDLDDLILEYSEIVFARTSPQQKLQIVEGFQRAGDIVAVTGDGVNDSPALKKADIGIAMGISGSNVSKEAADMILLDDNFSSIVTGIEEGRLIFDNIKKSIAYMLTSNLPEMFPFVICFLLRLPRPLTLLSILIIDIGTDLWPAISIAYEKAEADIMLRRPRNPYTDRLVTFKLLLYTNLTIGVIQTMAGLSSYFYVMSMYGFLPQRLLYIAPEWASDANNVIDSFGQEWTKFERQQLLKKCVAAYFLAIVMTQVADCLIVKTRRLSLFTQGMANCPMNLGIIFEIFLAFVCVYVPGLNEKLSFKEVNPVCLFAALPFAVFIIVFDEARKYFIRKHPTGWVYRETYY